MVTIERRNFIKAGLAFGALSAISSKSFLFGFGTPDFALRDVSPDLFWGINGLGNTILESTGATRLAGWMNSLTAAPKPPPQNFSEQYDPPVRIQSASGSFSNQTKLPDRSLVINNLPHLLETNMNPTSNSSLNVPEMHEMANTGNPMLYHVQCGCVYRIPLNAGPRREPNASDRDEISSWVRNSFLDWGYQGGVPTRYRERARDASLSLFYVRDFCSCYNIRLRGFALRDTREPENPALFAVV